MLPKTIQLIVDDIRGKVRHIGFSFIICGLVNTLFGYFGSVALYNVISPIFSTLLVLIIIKIVTISFSFLTYKKFVFKTKGQWLSEYLKCYVSYGLVSVLSIALLFVLLDILDLPFWFAQLIVTLVSACSSFIAHIYYTFNNCVIGK